MNTGVGINHNSTAIVTVFEVGNFDLSTYPRVGYTSVEQSIWLPHSSILSLSALGLKSSRKFVVTSGVQQASTSEVFSYDVPFPTKLNPTNQLSGRLDVVIGLHLGNYESSVRMRIGWSAAKESQWHSSTVILCKTAASHHKSLTVKITAGLVSGSLSGVASFDVQSLRRVKRFNIATFGGLIVPIQGAQFGILEYTARGGGGQTK